jgi:hypothetical protein
VRGRRCFVGAALGLSSALKPLSLSVKQTP